MSILDGILGQLGSNVDIANLASKVDLDPALAEKAVAALGAAHPQPGDTVATAASQTGIDKETLSQSSIRLAAMEPWRRSASSSARTRKLPDFGESLTATATAIR